MPMADPNAAGSIQDQCCLYKLRSPLLAISQLTEMCQGPQHMVLDHLTTSGGQVKQSVWLVTKEV